MKKTPRKATHQGTCQCCGSTQKLPGGVLSTHGYTRPDGYFEGTCRGTAHLPYELSADLLPELIAGATAEAERLNAFAGTVERGEHTSVRIRNPHRRYKTDPTYLYVGLAAVPAGYNIASSNRDWASDLRQQATATRRYAEDQQRRLDAWTPRPEALKPVREAEQEKRDAQEVVKAERAAKKAEKAAKPKMWTSSNCAFLDDVNAAILYVGGMYGKDYDKARKPIAATFREQGPDAALAALQTLLAERTALAGVTLKMVGEPYGDPSRDCLNWLEVSHALQAKGVKQ